MIRWIFTPRLNIFDSVVVTILVFCIATGALTMWVAIGLCLAGVVVSSVCEERWGRK